MVDFTLDWRVDPTSYVHAEHDVRFFPESDVEIDAAQNSNLGTLSKRELAEQLLRELENLGKTEGRDAFSDWVEDTVDLHLFDEIQPVIPEEQKSGMDSTEGTSTSNSEMTPPYSPGGSSGDSSFTLDYSALDGIDLPHDDSQDSTYRAVLNYVLGTTNNITVTLNFPEQHNFNVENRSQLDFDFLSRPVTPAPDLEREMAVVDEVVRRTAQSLEGNINVWDVDVSNSQVSSSDGLPGLEEEVDTDDSEWTPLAEEIPATQRRRPRTENPSADVRKRRKQEQNKSAASRYRQKKKAEMLEVYQQKKMLELEKIKLKQRITEIQTEIKYLKSLMREFFLDKDSN